MESSAIVLPDFAILYESTMNSTKGMRSDRRLAAIMFTDIVGYTAMMGSDEARAFQVLELNRKLQRPLIERYRGQWLKEMGDGILASFPSTTEALSCAKDIVSAARDADITLRVGIHLGEVVFQNGDVFGDGVNIAARVESLAVPDSVLFTGKVYSDIVNKPEFEAKQLGSIRLKNVPKAIEIYALVADGLAVPELTALQTARTPRRALGAQTKKGVILAISLLLLTVLGWRFLPWSADDSSPSVGTTPELITLAALPFSNISQEAEIDFLGFALVDQVINALAYLQNVSVRPSSSIRKYVKEVIDPQKVGDDLAVQYVLMGHYMKNQGMVRLNLELIDVDENNVQWRGTVQEEMTDIFHLQDMVADKVIDGLEIQFTPSERDRMVKDVPRSPLSYEYYLKAVDYPLSVDGSELAIDMLYQAIELDSTYAPAYNELGMRLKQLARYRQGDNRSALIGEAEVAMQHALRLNGGLLTALGNLAMIKTELNEKTEAVAFARKMLDLNPNNANAHFVLGYIYRYAGMLDEAIRQVDRAVAIDPNDRLFRSGGLAYLLSGRYHEAVQFFKRYEDGSGFSAGWQGTAYMMMGDEDKAIEMLEKAWQIDSLNTLGLWAGSKLAYLNGQTEGWIPRIRQIEEKVNDPESIYAWLVVNIMLGDYDYGLELLAKAVDLGYFPHRTFEIDPALDPIRERPEFRSIVERAKRKHEAFKERHFGETM